MNVPTYVEVCPLIVIQRLGGDGRGGGEQQESEMNGSEGEAKQEDKV